jgi:hypothetical protein
VQLGLLLLLLLLLLIPEHVWIGWGLLFSQLPAMLAAKLVCLPTQVSATQSAWSL